MSTIVTSNVSDGTLSIPTTFVTNGSAKAWVNFDGTGTIAARDSFNVSSLTDNGAGDYVVNLTTSMNNSDYAFAGALRLDTGSGTSNVFFNQKRNATQTASAFGVAAQNASPAFADCDKVLCSSHGDLA